MLYNLLRLGMMASLLRLGMMASLLRLGMMDSLLRLGMIKARMLYNLSRLGVEFVKATFERQKCAASSC